jgi:hypothetical protein
MSLDLLDSECHAKIVDDANLYRWLGNEEARKR